MGAVTVNDLLDGHVGLDLECLDRVYLNGYVPTLQYGGQVASFMTGHLAKPIPSPAIMERIGTRFRGDVKAFAATHQVPIVSFDKSDRKQDVMRPHLQRQARTGIPGVVAVGTAQEFQNVFAGSRHPGPRLWFTFYKTDRRVKCYYFYIWDHDFGPAFIKICSYFPYPMKVCLLTELNREGPRRCGKNSSDMATVRACDQRRAVPGPVLAGSAAARVAHGNWGSVRAVSPA
jgi:hypothetical protein